MNRLFRIPRGAGLDDIVIDMPRLVTTVGSAYLFMPGLAGLAFLSQPKVQPAGALTPLKPQAQADADPTLAPLNVRTARTARTALTAMTELAALTPRAPLSALPPFDPSSDAFRADPFTVYAAYRAQAPVMRFTFGATDTVWVFDNALVAAVAGDPTNYHKQKGNPHQLAGLLNMDEPPHLACRAALQPLFEQALVAMRQQVPLEVAARYQACQALPQPVDWVADFADGLARAVFFQLFGLGNRKVDGLMDKVDAALKLPSPNKEVALEAALKACGYQLSLLAATAPATSLIKQILGWPSPFDPDNPSLLLEQFANATVMVLAGVLPAKWAISLVTWHLLDNGGVLLQVLRANPGITDRAAAEELLRFDSPTPMSLRYAMTEQKLGGVAVHPGDRVMLAWASASRDAGRFGPNADSVDFSRTKGAGWAFGSANGFECLGKELVLLTLEAVIQALRAAQPVPRLEGGFEAVLSKDRLLFRALLDLPVHCR